MNICGWITPNKQFIPCESYKHLKALVDHPELPKSFKKQLKQAAEETQEAYDYCCKLADQDEHPEWHCYEMTKDHWDSIIYRKIYGAGFLRIADWGTTLYVEGAKFDQSHMQFCKDFAENHGFDGCKFENCWRYT